MQSAGPLQPAQQSGYCAPVSASDVCPRLLHPEARAAASCPPARPATWITACPALRERQSSGKGGGKEAQEPDANRGFRGEGEGARTRGGWRRRELGRLQRGEPRGRLHTFPGCAGNRTTRESSSQDNAAAGSGTREPDFSASGQGYKMGQPLFNAFRIKKPLLYCLQNGSVAQLTICKTEGPSMNAL